MLVWAPPGRKVFGLDVPMEPTPIATALECGMLIRALTWYAHSPLADVAPGDDHMAAEVVARLVHLFTNETRSQS